MSTLTNKNAVVMAYYTEWSIYQENFSVSQIPVNSITHLIYAFMLPNPSQADYDLWKANWSFPAKPYTPPPTVPEGTLVAQDGYANGINIANLKTLKSQNPNLKILISVGGWSMSFNFSTVFANATTRNNFVTSAVQFVVSNGFDGIDIDWEYPNKQGIGFNHVSSNDPANFVLTLQALCAEFKKQSPNKKYLLTAAIGANPDVIKNYQQIVFYLDYVNVMSYDFAGSWGNGGHLSALYYNPKETDLSPQWCTSAAITNTLNIGTFANKINLGLPLYGRGWAKIVPTDPTMPLFGTSTNGPAATYSGGAGEPGLSDWKDLVNVIGTNGLTEYYDPIAMASFVHNNTTGETWTYDNPKSIALKTQYALDNKLAGIFVWELSEDTRNGVKNLLNAAVNVLNAANGDQSNLNFDVTFQLTQTSTTGGTGTLSVTNNGSAQNNWSFQLNTNNFIISNLSNFTVSGTGNNLTISGSNIGQNQTLFGTFSYDGSGIFSATSNTNGVNVTLTQINLPTLNLSANIQLIQNTTSGGSGTISVTNNSSNLTNWSFNLTTTNFTITSSSLFNISGSGNNYIVSGSNINQGQTLTSNVTYNGSGTLNATTNTTGVILKFSVSNPPISGNLKVTIQSSSNWGSSGNGQITVTNNSSNNLTNWSFQLTTSNFVIQNFWNLSKQGSGNNITVIPPSWNSTINSGQTITSGFDYTGSTPVLIASTSTPNVVLIVINNSTDGGSINFTVKIQSTSNWGTGGNGNITITNNGNSVSDWSFNLNTLNFVIQNFWALSMTGSGNNIIVKPPSWSTTLAAGKTITSGFGYNGTSSVLQATSSTSGVVITN